MKIYHIKALKYLARCFSKQSLSICAHEHGCVYACMLMFKVAFMGFTLAWLNYLDTIEKIKCSF